MIKLKENLKIDFIIIVFGLNMFLIVCTNEKLMVVMLFIYGYFVYFLTLRKNV